MSTREELTRQAEKALRQGRITEAIAQYQELANLEPVDWGFVKLLADLLERAGQREAAARQFSRWADHLFTEGFHSKAAALFKKALKLEANDEHALWQLAEVSLELKLKADARVAFQRVADLRHRRGDAIGAATARDRVAAIEAAPMGPSAAPIRPPAYATAHEPPQDVTPTPPSLAAPQAFVRPTRPGLWQADALPVAPAPAPVAPAAPPPESPEARLSRLRHEAEAADALQAPEADARWHAVLEADPQDVATRLRLVQAALDRGDVDVAERLADSLDATESPALTVLVELAFRRARTDALERLIAGRVHAGAPPEHVLAPCASLASRHPGAARAVLSAAVEAWTAAGQPGHAVLALEHGESLGLLTITMHLRWVDICVDAGLPDLSRAQRSLALAFVVDQRFGEARAVAEDLFVREAGQEPHRALLLDILDRQGHPDPHRVLVDLLTPPSDTLDEYEVIDVVHAPAPPLVPESTADALLDDYGYLPPLRVPADAVETSGKGDDGFRDTGDSSIVMLDVETLLGDAAAVAEEVSPPVAPGIPAPTLLAAHDAPVTAPPVPQVAGGWTDDVMAPVRAASAAALDAWLAPSPAVAAAEPAAAIAAESLATAAPAPATSAEAPLAFDWSSILGRDIGHASPIVAHTGAPTLPVVAEPVPAPLVEPVAAAAPVAMAPATPEPAIVPMVAPAPAVPPPAPARSEDREADRGPSPHAGAASSNPAPVSPRDSRPEDIDTSPFAQLGQLQPALDAAAPLQPSFSMPSTWLSDGPISADRPRSRVAEDDYLFAEELPARWERSRLGIPSSVLVPTADSSAAPPPDTVLPPAESTPPSIVVDPEPQGLEDKLGLGADVAPGPLAAEPAALVDAPASAHRPSDATTIAPLEEPVTDGAPVVEEEVDLTQLLEELRQFDTVLPDPVSRLVGEAPVDAAPAPSLPATAAQPVLLTPRPARVSVDEGHHHDDLLPEAARPAPNEGTTELDAVFDDLQRHADDRSVAEQQLAAGRVFLAAGLSSEAARAFERASLEPRSRFAAAQALAELHKSRGQLQDAVSWYEQAAMAPVPDAAAKRPVLYDLAESLEAVGETNRALGVLLDLLSQVEDYRDARARLDRLLRVDAGG